MTSSFAGLSSVVSGATSRCMSHVPVTAKGPLTPHRFSEDNVKVSGFESTSNIRHAIKSLMPMRPAPLGNQRLVRFLALALVSLLVLLLALNLLSAVGVPKAIGIGLSITWMAIVSISAPTLLLMRAREENALGKRLSEWETNPRRLSMDRLALNLAAGRVPAGLKTEDIGALEETASDWRHGREALDGLVWAASELTSIRKALTIRMDEALANLLCEAGSAPALGLSPFSMERARALFLEISREANQVASSRATMPKFPTDESIEALRPELDRLRAFRKNTSSDLSSRERIPTREESH